MKIKCWTFSNYTQKDILINDGVWITLTPNLWKRKEDAEYAVKTWDKAYMSYPGETTPTGVKQITLEVSSGV